MPEAIAALEQDPRNQFHGADWRAEALAEYRRAIAGWSRFSLKAFHRVVLRDGAVPLSVLERRVEAWVEGARARPPR